MKPITKSILALLLLLQLAACGKKSEQADGPLTDCPATAGCQYSFYDTPVAYVTTSPQLNPGLLTFLYQQNYVSPCGLQNRLYFNINTTADNFELGDADVTSRTSYNTVCPCCDVVSVKALSGHISGKKINNDKWLIDGNVVLATTFNNKPIDTIIVRQYFLRKQ
ncbi:hypothetical protein C8P68_103321 [Mucilaginibacter yixingensis]|uniref:Lipoprotein n=1 Tax=Mucilaginibacter yixingensis TaxID=1295612 RepID=A0A2T5JBB1_9SPHI|nr:hypothetical protein [Mucilaginibacter yixingensis]PTQ98161.1 hypothetical protein C8P68_103321 [Mucilaginibacter yixingensis]